MRWRLKLPDKLTGFLKSKKGVLILCILGVVGLILACIPAGSGEAEIEKGAQSLEEYKLSLEGELADMCKRVEGVGECKVMVSFEKGAENVYKGSLLIESRPPKVLGVSVICRGGSSQSVKNELTGMFCALFDIGANRVAILELEK